MVSQLVSGAAPIGVATWDGFPVVALLPRLRRSRLHLHSPSSLPRRPRSMLRLPRKHRCSGCPESDALRGAGQFGGRAAPGIVAVNAAVTWSLTQAGGGAEIVANID